jgi:hypothetical protein
MCEMLNAEYGDYIGATLYVKYMQIIRLQNCTYLILVTHYFHHQTQRCVRMYVCQAVCFHFKFYKSYFH